MTDLTAYLASLPTSELLRQRPPRVRSVSYPDSPPEPATARDAEIVDEWDEAFDAALTARYEREAA